ncbi:MAG: flavodoxin family protein [Methanobacteriota archaeon]
MNAAIICESVHHGNTLKVAEAIAGELGVIVQKPEEVDLRTLSGYDLLGFGSGIKYLRHHKNILNLADSLAPSEFTRAFIFSTSGYPTRMYHTALKGKLEGKGYSVVGEFTCPGWDTWGPLKLFGGISKGRPNKQDLEDARTFAKGLKPETTIPQEI